MPDETDQRATAAWVVTPELEQQIVDRLVDWWCENRWDLTVRPGIHLHELMEDLYMFGVSDGRDERGADER